MQKREKGKLQIPERTTNAMCNKIVKAKTIDITHDLGGLAYVKIESCVPTVLIPDKRIVVYALISNCSHINTTLTSLKGPFTSS